MKKLFAMILSALLALSLTACSDEATGNTAQSGNDGKTVEDAFGGDFLARLEAAQSGKASDSENSAGWQEVDGDVPFGQYHTEEELLAMLESGDFSTYDVTFEEASEPLVVESEDGGEAFTYDPGEGVTGTFTEVQAAEAVKGGVYYIDWKSQMDPEALAEWEAFDPNDPAFLAQMEEADQMGEEVQQQLNEAMENIDMDEINQQLAEAMQELEGIGLPEGYEDILSGLDLSGLMGG